MTLDVFRKYPLPANWEWQKLGDICDVADRDHRTPAYQDGGIPLISPRDFTDRGIDLSRLKRVAPAELDAFRKKCKPAKGDILYSRIGTIGEARLVDFELDYVALHSIAIIKPRVPGLNSKYLLYLLQSPTVRSQAKHNIRSVGTPDLGLQRIKGFDVPIAPPSEQEVIVAEIEKQFSRLDEAVANLKRIKANLKRYNASILTAAVRGTLVGSQHAAYWAQVQIGHVAEVISGLTKNPSRQHFPRKLPYLRVANVYADELRLDDVEEIGVAEREIEKLLLQRGDMLVVEGNGSADQIGRVALWDGSISNCVHQNHLIKVRFGKEVMPRWALIWLLSPEGRREIEQVSSSTSGLHTLSTGKVRRLPLPLPPISEQQRIVEEVDRRMSLLREAHAATEAGLIRTERLRSSILGAALSCDRRGQT